MIVTLIFLAVLIGGMVIGMPIAHALILTGVALMWHLDFFDTQLLAQNLQAGFDNFPLLAVPFFILAGELMNAGGLSRRIIDLARAFVGHIPGGLGYVAIGAAVLLASMSGSAIADTAALATILLPMMRDQKYPDSYSAGLLASGGIIAPIIPPSMPFVIYGVTTNTSISKLFLSGVVPGLFMGGFLIAAWWFIARKYQLASGERVSWGLRLKALVKSFWAMMMPVIILGGLKGGVFTPTEAAVVAAVYALFVSMVVYREMSWAGSTKSSWRLQDHRRGDVPLRCGHRDRLHDHARRPAQYAGRQLLGPAGSAHALHGRDDALPAGGRHRHGSDPDHSDLRSGLRAAGVKAGIDPVYFGFMFIYVGCIGLITPPVGTVQNVVAGVGRLRMETVIKGTNPFLMVYVLLAVLFVIFPQLVTGPLKWMH
jgi:TRAP-type C4-dicarboxylate transport system permease large subunit